MKVTLRTSNFYCQQEISHEKVKQLNYIMRCVYKNVGVKLPADGRTNLNKPKRNIQICTAIHNRDKVRLQYVGAPSFVILFALDTSP